MSCRHLIFSVVAIAAFAVTNSSRADGGGYYGSAFPWFGYGNNGPAAYALGNVPTPPYFALHPPVYYSHPVARPYGSSPFACPCDCHHRDHESSRRIVINPYIETQPRELATKAQTNVAVVPTRVANPFYQAADKAEKRLASN